MEHIFRSLDLKKTTYIYILSICIYTDTLVYRILVNTNRYSKGTPGYNWTCAIFTGRM